MIMKAVLSRVINDALPEAYAHGVLVVMLMRVLMHMSCFDCGGYVRDYDCDYARVSADDDALCPLYC